MIESATISQSGMDSMLTYACYDDEHRLVDQIGLGEETEAEVDEDEILADLGQTCKNVSACPLGSSRHVMVRVMLESDTAKK